jgi:hypothetical protein
MKELYMEQVANRGLLEHFQVIGWRVAVSQATYLEFKSTARSEGRYRCCSAGSLSAHSLPGHRVERRFQLVMIGAFESTARVERNCTIGQ